MTGAGALRMGHRLAAALLGLATLGGCAGLGGNIKGRFACAAPDGICAPSAVIDDRALAMISGDPSASPTPAGPFDEQHGKPRAPRTAATQGVRTPEAADASRTRERVMRIIFPAYIDDYGRLHEASAIHTVVAEGEWRSAVDDSDPSPTRNALAAAPQMPSLAEVVDKAEAPLAVDPSLPTPAAVEAARARKADPVGAIKADVTRRLATTRRDVPGLSPPAAADGVARPAQPTAPTVAQPAVQMPGAGAIPAAQTLSKPSMQATAFPGAIPEDH